MLLASFFLCQINIQNAVAVHAPLALKCKYRGLPPQVVSCTSDSKTRCVILSAYRSLPHFKKLANKVKYPHLFGWPLFLGVKRIFRQNLMHLIQLQLIVSFFDTFTGQLWIRILTVHFYRDPSCGSFTILIIWSTAIVHWTSFFTD